jgi:hypothetical protein
VFSNDFDTREGRLWDEEVAAVLSAAPSLREPIRIALCAVLQSIAAEASDQATTRDVQCMLAAVSGSIHLHEAA